MTSVAERAVAEARTWIGTPYVHQASCLQAGSDCLGLLRGVWRALYGDEPETVPPYTQDWSEPQRDEILLRAAGRLLIWKPTVQEAEGDVLLFRMRSGHVAKHLGIQSSVGANRRFIHAYSGHRVTESALTDPWRRRIAARFAFPDGVR